MESAGANFEVDTELSTILTTLLTTNLPVFTRAFIVTFLVRTRDGAPRNNTFNLQKLTVSTISNPRNLMFF